MSNSKDIFKALISEDLVNAKKFINNALLEKLGNSLEEKLVNFAPTVFNEEKGESEKKEAKKELSPNQMRIARMAGDKDKIDAEDFKELRRRKKNESVETDQELESIAEEFEQELASLIEEIEQELGEELTEDEIKELADDLLDALNEQEETEDEEDEEDEEDTSVQKPMRNVGGDAY
jgi:hypothetical protein